MSSLQLGLKVVFNPSSFLSSYSFVFVTLHVLVLALLSELLKGDLHSSSVLFCFTAVSVYFLLPYGCILPRRWLLTPTPYGKANEEGSALWESTRISTISLRDPVNRFQSDLLLYIYIIACLHMNLVIGHILEVTSGDLNHFLLSSRCLLSFS